MDPRQLPVLMQAIAEARTNHKEFPKDLVRGAAIVAEEAGEVVKAALDATRPTAPPDAIQALRKELYQTAAAAIMMISQLDKGAWTTDAKPNH